MYSLFFSLVCLHHSLSYKTKTLVIVVAVGCHVKQELALYTFKCMVKKINKDSEHK
jgi:hypothetical protein